MSLAHRASLIAALALAACGGSEGSGPGGDDRPDAAPSIDGRETGPADAPPLTDAPDCALVVTMPAPPLTSITGHYLLVADDAEALEPACFNRPCARSASTYLEHVDGQLRRYTRTYDSG